MSTTHKGKRKSFVASDSDDESSNTASSSSSSSSWNNPYKRRRNETNQIKIPKSLQLLTTTQTTLRTILFAVIPSSHPPIPPESTAILNVLLDSTLVCIRNQSVKLNSTFTNSITSQAKTISDAEKIKWKTKIFRTPTPPLSSFTYETDHQELIEHLIVQVMKTDQQNVHLDWKDRNLLTLGFEMGGNWFSNDSTTSMKNKDNLHQKAHNSMTDFLMTKPWIELHKWCGDTIIIWLLTQTLLFQKLTNGCWLQLTGHPLNSLSTKLIKNNNTDAYNSTSNNSLLPRSRIFYVRSATTVPGLSPRHFIQTYQYLRNGSPTSKISAKKIVLQILKPNQYRNMSKRSKMSKKNTTTTNKKSVSKITTKTTTKTTTAGSAIVIQSNRRRLPFKMNLRLSKKWNLFFKIVHDMLLRHEHIDYRQNLERQCPLPYNNLEKNDLTLEQYIASGITHTSVFNYIVICLKQLFPRAIFHTNYNWRLFFQAVHRFVTQGRYETMSAKTIAEQFQTRDIPWYPNTGNHLENRRCFVQFIHWCFTTVVIPIVRSSFYATETQTTPNVVSYYRKSTWWKIEELGKHFF